MKHLGVWLAAMTLAAGAPGAIQLDVGTRDVEEALKLARASELDRGRFHAAYQAPVSGSSVESLEVITEYRRMVLLAEERLVLGQYGWLTREAEEALKPWKRTIALRAQVRLNPHNVYPTPPAIQIVLGRGPGELRPSRTQSDAKYGLTGGRGAGSMIAVVIEAVFDAPAVGQRTLVVTVRGPDSPDFVSSIDFARLR